MRRNEKGLDQIEGKSVPGFMIARNPGVVALYETRNYRRIKVSNGLLVSLGSPDRVDFWAEGRAATREEVLYSIETGFPELLRLTTGPEALDELNRSMALALALLPTAAPDGSQAYALTS